MASFRPQNVSDIDPDMGYDGPRQEQEVNPDLDLPDYKSMRIRVRRLRFHEPDTGFFIATGEAIGRIPQLPPELSDHGQPVANQISVKGTSASFIDNTNINESLEMVGEWELNGKYGLQFDVKYIKAEIPLSLGGLEKYLCSGQLKWIGPATAKMIVDKWGLDTVRIMDNSPHMLTEIHGITESRALEISQAWIKNRDFIGLVAFLGEFGITEKIAMKIREEFSEVDLEAKIRKNPYVLTQVSGINFLTADKLALSLGVTKDSPLRFRAALEHTLTERMDEEGHTAIPVSEWIDVSVAYLRQPRDVVKAMCQELVKEKKVVVRKIKMSDKNNGFVPISCVSPFKVALMENEIATELKRLSNTFVPLESVQENDLLQVIEDPSRNLDPSQKDAVWNAFQYPIGVLTGGPGTGKTTTLKSIVFAARQMGWNVILAAPTGRAAKRMEEAILLQSMTMHRRLGFNKEGFTHSKDNPMQGDFFVVDEMSMVDTPMTRQWLQAIPSGARILCVGDADQLPSVGMGDVLRDFCESQKLPVSRLTRVHRQAEGSGIAYNAQLVNQGKMPSLKGDPWSDDFFFVSATNNMAIRDTIYELIEGYLRQGASYKDIQVLCPQKNKDCGTIAINELIRGLLNPHNPSGEELQAPICVGDRLMQTKNDYELEVFNGDMGNVTKLDANTKKVWMEMEDGRVVEYEKSKQKNLIYANASTVHKSQGGERPIVLIPITREHRMTLSKSLVYTGITRGKFRVGLIGDSRVLHQAIKSVNQVRRITGLVEEMERVNLDMGIKETEE